jgi:hypothetical protein
MLHPSHRVDRTRVVGGLIAALLAASPAHPSNPRDGVAVRLERTIPIHGSPAAAADGTIWLIGTDGALRFGPPPVPSEGSPPDASGWRTIPPPAGIRLERVALGPGGAVWATGRHGPGNTTHVLRLRRAREEASWEFEDVPLVGYAFDVAVGPSGEVWLGGEWRDLFRRVDGRWERIVPPVPYHVDRVVPNDDGTAWILASTRGVGAVIHWRPDGMHVRYRGREMTGDPAGHSSRSIDVRLRDRVVRIHADEGKDQEMIPGVPGFEQGVVTVDRSRSGWVARGSVLERWTDGSRRWSETLPFRVSGIADLGTYGIYIRDVDRNSWRLDMTGDRVDGSVASGLPGFDRTEPLGWRHRESYLVGTTVIPFAGKRRVYVVDAHGANLLLTPDALASPSPDPVGGWRTEAARVGIEGPRWNDAWYPAYDSGALAADLDGDGHNDLLLFTMYQGIRVYRNVDDDHFVEWTREAAIRSDPEDDAMGGCLLDFDGDGDLDLYVANLLVGDRLLRNNGAAVFEDVTRASGIDTGDGSHSATCVDLDGDGDTDVAVATWGRGVVLHENLGAVIDGPRFATHRVLADRADLDGTVTLSTRNVSGIEAADLDRDGLPELFASAHPGPSALLRNRGSMRFEEDPIAFPGTTVDRGVGAAFADVDHDGDLDLLTSGHGEVRLWNFEGDRFRRVGDPLGGRPTGLPEPVSAPIVTGDFDDDGDLDVVWGKRDGPLVFDRNRVDDGRSVVVRIEGPPVNPGAIGATVELFPEGRSGEPGGRIGWRFVGASSGPRSHAPQEAHFGGISPGVRVDLLVRLPDGTRRLVEGIRTPFHGTIEVLPSTVARSLRGVAQKARRLLGDPWTPRFAGVTAVGTIALLIGALVLYRGARPGVIGWAAVASGPVLSFGAYLASPLDPGVPSILGAPAFGTFAAGTILAFVRTLMRQTPAPELLTELSVALRAFRHNQTPKRILGRLQFDLDNLGEAPFRAASPRAVVLKEDLRAYREVVLPELNALVRLAGASGIAGSAGSATLAAQSRLLPALLSRLESAQAGTEIQPGEFRELRSSIETIAAWIDRTGAVTDRRLAIDLPRTVGDWVASRRGTVPFPIAFLVVESGPILARFVAEDLRRVLDVLLENAARALAGNPGGRVEIRIESDGPGRVSLALHDNGPGVAESNREQVFALGFTGDGGGGEGYGLYYARRTVQRYGATIAVGDPSKAGGSFVITLDRLPPASAESAA